MGKKSLGTKLFFRRLIGSTIYFVKKISSTDAIPTTCTGKKKTMISPGFQNDELEFGDNPES